MYKYLPKRFSALVLSLILFVGTSIGYATVAQAAEISTIRLQIDDRTSLLLAEAVETPELTEDAEAAAKAEAKKAKEAAKAEAKKLEKEKEAEEKAAKTKLKEEKKAAKAEAKKLKKIKEEEEEAAKAEAKKAKETAKAEAKAKAEAEKTAE
ncbi:hypothetical protein NIES2119_30250 [[Phormidium ambiguum] IAM M-71]|uniref:Protein TolA n=1 Tax=[Phormidium ambiguum] IAM M-71 TaxID=454136 RepID=A0A1U7I3T9_9CYAN|nr:hypothetical protein [Phormidium ambiguum]OKH30773.1 hypothetical protein NIES2119_30250 [Phormidium ambiguum IAM M-71]